MDKNQITEHFTGRWELLFSPHVKKAKGLKGDEIQGLCPFHDDTSPSFSFNRKTGTFHCFGCHAEGDALTFYAKANGLDIHSDFPKVLSRIAEQFHIGNGGNGNGKRQVTPFHHYELGKPSKVYGYTDEAGKVLFHNCRFDQGEGKKTFRQCQAGGMVWNLNGVRLVPYNLPAVIGSSQVIVVEGEKDCFTMEQAGYVATTNPAGAGKWRDEYSDFLKGKDVVLIPDNDEPGKDHMRKVAASLQRKAKSVRWLDIPGLPEKGDVSDWMQAHQEDMVEAFEGLKALIARATPITPDGKVEAGKLPPLTPKQTYIYDFIEKDPPAIEYIFKDILPAGIVGGVIGQGGVSKSFFMLTLGIGAATGQAVLKHFEATRTFKTLALFLEDPEAELHRRIHFTVKQLFPELSAGMQDLLIENFHAKSVMGQAGPLMMLDSGNPARSEWFFWLRETIKAHEGLELLLLDPKSRLYGLDENSNDHATAWISALEELSRDFHLTILFSHHVSKASGGALNQSSARGGSALVDGARWIGNLKTMDEKMGEKFEIEDFRSFVEFDVSKSNYAPRLLATVYFRRGEGGVLVPVNLEFHRLKDNADRLCTLLVEWQGEALTRRELLYLKQGAEVREDMGCRRVDLEKALDYAIKENLISVFEAAGTGKRNRGILTVERTK